MDKCDRSFNLMATTTPNFGWPVPTSSDLVKNGATAIEGLGDAIDASLLDLKGGTTNQVLAKNSNTDMDFKWVSDATGMTNPMTTTGDVIYSSSGSTPARLGLGTAGQVLQVNSGATAPEWATPAGGGGGMTSIASGSLSGSAVNLTSISSSYKNLQLVVRDFYPATNTNSLVLRLMNDSGASQYVRLQGRSTNATWSVGSADRWYIDDGINGNLNSQSGNQYIIDIPDYANAATMKNVNMKFGYLDQNSVYSDGIIFGLYKATGAINQINLLLSGGNFGGGTYVLYGVQ
jgi:hypothetical protein